MPPFLTHRHVKSYSKSDRLAVALAPWVISRRLPPAVEGALVRGSSQGHALPSVARVTDRCGTTWVGQARSAGSGCCTHRRPPAVVPLDCALEDGRRQSTCTGRTRSPRAPADGSPTPSSSVGGRGPAPAESSDREHATAGPRRDNDAVLVGGTTTRAHHIATDGHGDIYTAEARRGRRAQKFVFNGMVRLNRLEVRSCALGFSWTLDCERVLAGGVSR